MEKEYIVDILDITSLTHNVKRIRAKKPKGYMFNAGQATEVSVNKDGLRDKKSPFTFTCLNDKDYIEFIIKIYPEHNGVTKEIDKLNVSDSLIIRDSWGTIEYKGKGIFIAGGAGITPFIAIFRQLRKENNLKGNILLYSNKTESDIILKDELKEMLGDDCIFLLSDENKEGYLQGRIDNSYLKEHITDFSKYFYVCGPPIMTLMVRKILQNLSAKPESIIFEK